MKKSILLILILFVNAAVFSQTVNKKTALKVAENFWKINKKQSITSAVPTYAITKQNDTLIRVININNSGFVFVSNDKAASPILGYSDEGVFDANNIAPSLKAWLQSYSQKIAELHATKSKTVNPKWTSLLSSGSINLKTGEKTVAPFIATKWNQDKWYNSYCPVSSGGPEGRCYTGCVATAMGQIMKYYGYPDHGFGSHSYVHPYFGTISADFQDSTYNWANMANSATNANQKYISLILFHCGVSVNMNYSPTGSGSQSEDVPDAMKNYFHYRNTINYKDRSTMTDADWIFTLKDNLDRHMPVFYSGSDGSEGHAWVCDGYDANDFFHMNWGWGGANNGFCSVDSLDSGNGNFSSSQGIVVEIAPYFAPYCVEGRIMTDSTRVINDGSGYSNYWNDTHCDWLLSPTDAEKVHLDIYSIDLKANDVLSIYNGTSTSAPLLQTFTNVTIDTTISLVASSGKMYLVFSTDSVDYAQGWTAKYWCTKVGEGINENNFSTLTVTPNPATDFITIRPDNTSSAITCKIYNYVGELVSTNIIDKNTHEYKLDLNGLNSGMYFIVVESSSGKQAGKFIKL